jgi:predicted dehydrogenase
MGAGLSVRPFLKNKVKVGVIGAGVFGGYHAQKFGGLAGGELAGVMDLNPRAAGALVEKVGSGDVFQRFEELAEACDAVVIASPAATHAGLARRALEADLHALVEKPLALTGNEARALAQLALNRDLILQVGHQERLVFAAMGLLGTPERPTRIESARMSERSPQGRCEDVSVVFDLMIHDLDLAAELFGGEASAVNCFGRTAHTNFLDEASAELTFAGGVARLTASRCSTGRKRTMCVDFPSGRVEIDFLKRDVRNDTPFDIRLDISESLPDPLKAADAAFLAAIRGEAVSPATGGVGARAAAMAELVERGARLAVAA